MHPIRLTKKVIIKGPDFRGLRRELTFYPLESKNGWMWWSRSFLISINSAIVDTKVRRVRLCFEGKKLQIFEHLGVLRWFGLCGLSIQSSPWPPYYGRSSEFWQAIKPFCEENKSEDIKWYTIREPVKWTYLKLRNNQAAFTEIYPNTRKELKVKIMCSYPGIGAWTDYFSFPNREILEELCTAYNQCWPPYFYYFSKIASRGRWPHDKTFTLARVRGKQITILKQFINHRVTDLLGTLSLLCRDGLLSADVTSICSGHEADVNAIIQADKSLYRFD